MKLNENQLKCLAKIYEFADKSDNFEVCSLEEEISYKKMAEQMMSMYYETYISTDKILANKDKLSYIGIDNKYIFEYGYIPVWDMIIELISNPTKEYKTLLNFEYSGEGLELYIQVCKLVSDKTYVPVGYNMILVHNLSIFDECDTITVLNNLNELFDLPDIKQFIELLSKYINA